MDSGTFIFWRQHKLNPWFLREARLAEPEGVGTASTQGNQTHDAAFVCMNKPKNVSFIKKLNDKRYYAVAYLDIRNS